MKLRLGASISPLFAGEPKTSIFKAISIKPNFTLLFHGEGKSNRLLLQGFKSLQRWVHSSSTEEDDFSELGLPMAQGVGTLLKLATEKPEVFMKKDPARKATVSGSSCAENRRSAKGLLLSLDKGCNVRPKNENHNNISRSIGNSKGDSNFKNSGSISIENVPSIVNLSQLIEAVSSFGKIYSASMRDVPNGLDCCDVEFENVESTMKAVSVGGITVRNFHLPIRPLYVPESVMVRIKDISKDTADTAIHSMCKSIGALKGMSRERADAVDVIFSLMDYSDAQNILTKLNDTIIDDCRWSAHLLPTNSIPAELSKNENAKCELGLQISDHLKELKREIYMKRVYAEDLEYMHLAIMHFKEQPTISNASDMD